ncbi:hypothetical protein [Desulfoluna spongiiphila]|uniref:Ribbon-helix-helix protein, copG family n=1 Tax=Desulfoluna spongiiphila TaxID=419481 RepID=A0A1G5ADJ7_9BACT|nr:hypothetical protein [Desulfoluna spongiiphila]SCX75935.1 hypothetical protein SAMN05216233_10178 [Desulfoluna spongiiphila]
MTTLEDRREADRKRQEKWRQKQSQSGKRAISATISTEAWEILQAIKERTGTTNSEAIERVLLHYHQEHGESH